MHHRHLHHGTTSSSPQPYPIISSTISWCLTGGALTALEIRLGRAHLSGSSRFYDLDLVRLNIMNFYNRKTERKLGTRKRWKKISPQLPIHGCSTQAMTSPGCLCNIVTQTPTPAHCQHIAAGRTCTTGRIRGILLLPGDLGCLFRIPSPNCCTPHQKLYSPENYI